MRSGFWRKKARKSAHISRIRPELQTKLQHQTSASKVLSEKRLTAASKLPEKLLLLSPAGQGFSRTACHSLIGWHLLLCGASGRAGRRCPLKEFMKEDSGLEECSCLSKIESYVGTMKASAPLSTCYPAAALRLAKFLDGRGEGGQQSRCKWRAASTGRTDSEDDCRSGSA